VLAPKPRLQQGEEELHELLAVLLHAVVCGGGRREGWERKGEKMGPVCV
jgi:hypothetical protein